MGKAAKEVAEPILQPIATLIIIRTLPMKQEILVVSPSDI
jgi:hypothetical protein